MVADYFLFAIIISHHTTMNFVLFSSLLLCYDSAILSLLLALFYLLYNLDSHFVLR